MKTKSLKSPLFVSVLFSSLTMSTLFISSCSNELKAEDSSALSDENIEIKFVAAKENDAEFLVAVAEINIEQIELGKLAQINSSNQDVRELGKMMEIEHSAAMKDLKHLAATKNIIIPNYITNDGKDAFKNLARKKGKDFDEEYCSRMIKGHKNTISKYERATTGSSDPDIQSWAETMLPILRVQLDHATSCQKKCENKTH